MKPKPKVLFVCTANKDRSATAHRIYERDVRFEVKSAGTAAFACIVISADLLNWADCILVMGTHHEAYLRQKFPEICATKCIFCLDVPDAYLYMQPDLVSLLKEKVEALYKQGHISKSPN